MLRKRILAAATATILALGMSMGGAGAAFAKAAISEPVSSSGGITVYDQNGLTCNDFPGTLSDNLDVSLGEYDAPAAPVGGSWGSLDWDGDTLMWDIADDWTVDLCIKGGNKVVWINDVSGTGSYAFKSLQGNGISHVNFADATYTEPEPLVASASLAFIDPTCDSPEALDEVDNFTTTGVSDVDVTVDGLSYTVVFTADEGYEFPAAENVTNEGMTLTIKGDLDPALTGEECGEVSTSVSPAYTVVAASCVDNLPVGGSIMLNTMEGMVSYVVTDSEGAIVEDLTDLEPGTYTVTPTAVGDDVELNLSSYEPEAEVEAFDGVCGELITFPLVEPFTSATQPTCDTANGSYTLSATEGVTWFVNGLERAAGTYQAAAGTTVSIEADAQEGFGFGFEQQTEWSYTFTAADDCDEPELPTLALTGVTGLAGTAALVALLITLTGVGMVAARRRVEV